MFVLRHFRTKKLLTGSDGEPRIFFSIPEVYERMIGFGIYSIEIAD